MTDNIDRALQLLRQAEMPGGAVNFENAVMAGIDIAVRAREARPSLGVGLGAAAVAMTIGLASVNITPVPEKVSLELSVFSADAAFAPALLLATEG